MPSPVPTAARVKNTEATMNNGFLPYLSAKLPEIITPNKQPKIAQPITQPCIEGELANAKVNFIKWFCSTNYHPVVSK